MGYIKDMIDKINIFKTCLNNTEKGQPKKQSIEDEDFERELHDLIEGMREPRKKSIADELGLDFIVKTKKKLKAIKKIHERIRKFSFGKQEKTSKNDIKKEIQKDIETTLIDQTKTSVVQDRFDQSKIDSKKVIKKDIETTLIDQTKTSVVQERFDQNKKSKNLTKDN